CLHWRLRVRRDREREAGEQRKAGGDGACAGQASAFSEGRGGGRHGASLPVASGYDSTMPRTERPAPAFLDDQQVERLGQVLDHIAIPNGGFNMEALDGFLSALAVSPETVPPSEW